MMVAKSVSIDIKDLTEIQEKIKNDETTSFSGFVRKAIKNELKR